MPGRVYSALNTDGTPYTTPADEIALRQQSQAQDWMVQQAMMAQRAQEFQANLADRNNERNFQTNLQGSFGQKSAQATALENLQGQYGLENTRLVGQNQTGYATAMNQPRNREIDMEQQRYADQSAQRGYQNAAAQYQTNRLNTQGQIDSALDAPVLQMLKGFNPGSGSKQSDNVPAPGQPGVDTTGGEGAGFRNVLGAGDLKDVFRARLGLGADPSRAANAQIAQYLLASQDPQQKAAGAKLYANLAGNSIDAQVQGALSKVQLPIEQALTKPDVSEPLSRVLQIVNQAKDKTYVGPIENSPDYTNLQSAINEATNALVNRYGVLRPEADSFIKGKILGNLNPDESGLVRGEGILFKSGNQGLRRLYGQVNATQ